MLVRGDQAAGVIAPFEKPCAERRDLADIKHDECSIQHPQEGVARLRPIGALPAVREGILDPGPQPRSVDVVDAERRGPQGDERDRRRGLGRHTGSNIRSIQKDDLLGRPRAGRTR